MRKSHKGQEKVKKVYSVGCEPAREVRAEFASVDFLGDAQKLEGQTTNGVKPGTLVRSKKKSAENYMPRQDPLKGKLATSEGNLVLEASVDYRGDCFQFGAITRKMIGNGDFSSAKRSIFKDERVNSSKNSSKNESSHFIEAKRNNKNPSIISSGSMRADNCTPSTTEPYDNMNTPQLMKSFKGSGDVSISSSAGIEDLIKKSFNGTNGRNFKHNKTSGTHVRSRRRALRFVEDDDGEECRTPIHHVTAVTLMREYSGTFDSERKFQMQPESCKDFPQNASLSNTGFSLIGNVGSRVDERPSNLTGNMEMMDSCFSASRPRNVEANVLKYSADLLECSYSVKQKKFKTAFPNGRAANEKLATLVCPGNMDKLASLKTLKDQVRGENPYNAQFGESCKAFGTSHFSCSPAISQNPKLPLEKSKSNSSGLTFTENSSIVNFSAECYTVKDVSAGQRSDITREATSADSSADSKLTDSGMSMKHLIAAAQAKRRQAHSHQLHDGNGTPRSSLTPQCIRGRSPNQMSTVQTLPSGGDPFQKDKKWFQTSVHNEPSLTSHQFLPAKWRDPEDFDHRPSTRSLQPTDSSSGGTEAAVARDALEGMIETLSRARDSIGRATRHAIDCAKYGIANEVVELLIHKLEGEPSLSHRIDLFFLVDSITQCSHAQKGIAGASYVPVVQAALPRLLGAAAPAGPSAHENRRQCLKVLRLWLERKILPEYFLRSCMDEIEVRNDGLNSEVSHRIPSCVEQCVDDPIREMESLLVDQYGSNTTFLFAGNFSADDLEGDEDFRSSPYTGTTDCSPHEAGGVSEVLLISEGRRMDAHHHALEHVENEIEMEDALTISPDERSIGGGSSYSFPDQENCWVFESTCGNQNELLLLREGSPLPLDPSLATPPLPPSPPPPTPPPPSSPPPMPPPKSPPTIPLPLELSAVISLTQSQMPSSSCPYRCNPSLPQEYCRMENDKKLLQPIGKNATEVSTVELKNDSVVQQSPIFLATGINNTEFMFGITSSLPFEIAHDRHLTHEVSHSSKLFQQGGETIQQMPSDSALPALRILNHPLLSSQMLSDPLSHGNSICQHHLQQKYSPYTSTFPFGQRKYGAEEQWMSHCSDVDQDYYDAWNIGRKISSCSGAPPVQDGCCRLNMERTSTSIDFHHPPHYSAPSQASLTGDSFHNFTGIDFWRPT
ncbi:hypothetical protein KFK09_001271 [Dendrobium nobile]|uniref:CID domain-containing protein n=1 Tax=Dendrobium nobile TaxID=94219 RepID=A0A8T3C950_DENNO|nr:hypothetical protein KFK09_001271 [Dendrobium nobile]